jgi:hypothetical protein
MRIAFSPAVNKASGRQTTSLRSDTHNDRKNWKFVATFTIRPTAGKVIPTRRVSEGLNRTYRANAAEFVLEDPFLPLAFKKL